ncbi:hypothetical protein [Parendozoicomonas haliclonae]|uniref:hypothetical protein n=1 Tax=Parendozoicomonas haliclonae TaxID=1960125 RepID=UPI000B35B34F|nr:hypothetical protein [Parendozoicomonas haliclonae]
MIKAWVKIWLMMCCAFLILPSLSRAIIGQDDLPTLASLIYSSERMSIWLSNDGRAIYYQSRGNLDLIKPKRWALTDLTLPESFFLSGSSGASSQSVLQGAITVYEPEDPDELCWLMLGSSYGLYILPFDLSLTDVESISGLPDSAYVPVFTTLQPAIPSNHQVSISGIQILSQGVKLYQGDNFHVVVKLDNELAFYQIQHKEGKVDFYLVGAIQLDRFLPPEEQVKGVALLNNGLYLATQKRLYWFQMSPYGLHIKKPTQTIDPNDLLSVGHSKHPRHTDVRQTIQSMTVTKSAKGQEFLTLGLDDAILVGREGQYWHDFHPVMGQKELDIKPLLAILDTSEKMFYTEEKSILDDSGCEKLVCKPYESTSKLPDLAAYFQNHRVQVWPENKPGDEDNDEEDTLGAAGMSPMETSDNTSLVFKVPLHKLPDTSSYSPSSSTASVDSNQTDPRAAWLTSPTITGLPRQPSHLRSASGSMLRPYSMGWRNWRTSEGHDSESSSESVGDDVRRNSYSGGAMPRRRHQSIACPASTHPYIQEPNAVQHVASSYPSMSERRQISTMFNSSGSLSSNGRKQ